MRKYLSNVHKIKGAHRQCVNNHYAKFAYKGMKKKIQNTSLGTHKSFAGERTDDRTDQVDCLGDVGKKGKQIVSIENIL